MTLVKDLMASTRRLAYGSMSEQINLVRGGYSSGSGILDLELDVQNIIPGMIVSSGLNVWYVTAVDTGLKQVHVVSQFDDSMDEDVADKAIVLLRPRVTDWHLFWLMNEQIKVMSSPARGLYRIREYDVPAQSSGYGSGEFPIPTDVLARMDGLARVLVSDQYANHWTEVAPHKYRMQMHGSFGSVRFLRDYAPTGGMVRFLFKESFVSASTIFDDVELSCGLSASMLDIPPLGGAVTLLRTTESRRNQISAQGDPRRADEVPPGSNSSIAREFQREYDNRVDEEYARLNAMLPIYKGM